MIASSNIRPFLHFPLPFGLLGLILMWWGWMGQASFQALPGILLWTPVLRTASLKRHALFICLIHYQRKFRQGRKRRGLPMYLVFVCLRFLCLWLVSGACKSIFDAGDRPRCWPSAWRTQECPACTGLELCILHWVLEFCRFISWCLVCFFLSGVFERKIYSAAGLSQLDLMRLWTWCPTTHWSRHMFVIISSIQPVVCCQQCVWPQVVPSFAPRFYNRIVQERLEIFNYILKSFKLHSCISLFEIWVPLIKVRIEHICPTQWRTMSWLVHYWRLERKTIGPWFCQASMPMQAGHTQRIANASLVCKRFLERTKAWELVNALGSSESIDDSTPETAAECLDPVFFWCVFFFDILS